MTHRWGIAGPGAIAVGFANGLAELPDAELVGVGSRALDRAGEFADRHGARHAHGSYEELAADPDVDIVYVATPQSRHMDDTLLFLEAGKHVLCEKPFALSEAQGRRMIETARANGVFVMEALWSRFLPSYVAMREVIASGEIGEPNYVESDFGFIRPFDATNRLFDLAQGGGCLLDLGVYPVHLAHMILGVPSTVKAVGHIGVSGVDECTVGMLGYDNGAIGVVKASLNTNMTLTGRVCGTEGSIDIPALMHCPNSFMVQRGRDRREVSAPIEGQGLKYQAIEVHRCLEAGLLESPVMSHADTLAMANTMDRIRAEIGMHYQSE